MKQKNSPSDFVTKDYLDRALDGIRKEIQFSSETVIGKIGRKMQEHNDANFTRLDKIVAELEEIREDKIIGTHQTREIREQVDNHEKRIKRLEVRQTA